MKWVLGYFVQVNSKLVLDFTTKNSSQAWICLIPVDYMSLNRLHGFFWFTRFRQSLCSSGHFCDDEKPFGMYMLSSTNRCSCQFWWKMLIDISKISTTHKQFILRKEQSETALYAHMPGSVNVVCYLCLDYGRRVGHSDLIPNQSCNLMSMPTLKLAYQTAYEQDENQ